MPRIVETFVEFKQRMARTNIDPDNPLRQSLQIKNRWLFWNGAQSDGNERHAEPPDSEVEVLAFRAEYVSALLDKSIAQYKALRDSVAEQMHYFKANAGASPDEQFPNWKSKLEKLGSRIENLSGELRGLAARGRELIGPDVSEHQRRYRDDQRAAAANVARELAQLPTY